MEMIDKDEKMVPIKEFTQLFHDVTVIEDEVLGMNTFNCTYKCRNGCELEFGFLNYERMAHIALKEGDRILIKIYYDEAYIKLLDVPHRKFELSAPYSSVTIFSFDDAPMVTFFDMDKKRNRTDQGERQTLVFDPIDLMILFDDFAECIEPYSNEKYYTFSLTRGSNKFELTVMSTSVLLKIIFCPSHSDKETKSETVLLDLTLTHCDFLNIYPEKSILVMRSGYDDKESYIECHLILDDNPVLSMYNNAV